MKRMRLNLNRARSYLLTVCQKRSVPHIPKLLVSNAVWAPLLECANHNYETRASRSNIYTSTIAHEDGYALPPREAGGPVMLSGGFPAMWFNGHTTLLDLGTGIPRNQLCPRSIR